MDFMIIHKEFLVVFIRFLGNKYNKVNICSQSCDASYVSGR